jgi:hypothetical protein
MARPGLIGDVALNTYSDAEVATAIATVRRILAELSTGEGHDTDFGVVRTSGAASRGNSPLEAVEEGNRSAHDRGQGDGES